MKEKKNKVENKVIESHFKKILPNNTEAEAAIISAILIDNSTLYDLLDLIDSHDFYSPAHQIIFDGIKLLFTKNEPIDLVTLAEILKSQEKLESIGGALYLAKIIDLSPVPSNAQSYAKIIKNKSILRRLIQQSSKMIEYAFEENANVEEVVNFSEKTIFEIAEDKIKPSFFALSQLLEQSIDILEQRQASPDLFTGIPTGFSQLDKLLSGLQKSDLIILAARPSMGKTAFALNIARNVALDARIPVLIFSLEMSKEQLSMRVLTSEASVDSIQCKQGKFNNEDWIKLTQHVGILSKSLFFIDDSSDITTIDIRSKARRLALDKGLGLIIIDYLQLMKPSIQSERRDLEIADISRTLKSIAKELNVPVIALSQLNRMLEQRADKHPVLADLRESGALEQDADVVAFIYRDEVYNKDPNNPNKGKAEIIIAKNRNGPIGVVNLAFLNAFTRFEDLAIGNPTYYGKPSP
ncbi:MAG: replicative DNA helicase [Desulfobacterales bacterium]|nr:replicative DNA helicase [Desulfobacterales bacterium]